MIKKIEKAGTVPAGEQMFARGVRVLLLEAPYYASVMTPLVAGALEALEEYGCSGDRFAVPGALELPQALELAAEQGLVGGDGSLRYAGAVALGCVIRGETSHYDIVCNSTNHWLMEVAMRHRIPLGNAVLTVENEAQALARAEGGARSGKGAEAVRACLRLIWLRSHFQHHAKAVTT